MPVKALYLSLAYLGFGYPQTKTMANFGSSVSSSSSPAPTTVKHIYPSIPNCTNKYTAKLSYSTYRANLISAPVFTRNGPGPSFISKPIIGHTGITFHVHLNPDNTSVYLSLDENSVIPSDVNLNCTFKFSIESDYDRYGGYEDFVPRRGIEITGIYSENSGSANTNSEPSLLGWEDAYERRAIGTEFNYVAQTRVPNRNYKKKVSFEVEHWFTYPQPIDHHHLFHGNLRSLMDQFTDVTLVMSDGQLLAAHKLILSTQSPVFRSMFSNDGYIESQTGRVLIMEDISTETMRRLLKYIYGCDTTAVNEGDLIELLKAAHAYEVTPLINEIIATMINRTTVANCCQYLYYADLYSFATLKVMLLDFICDNQGVMASILASQEGQQWMGPRLMNLYSERLSERVAIEAEDGPKDLNDEKAETSGASEVMPIERIKIEQVDN